MTSEQIEIGKHIIQVRRAFGRQDLWRWAIYEKDDTALAVRSGRTISKVTALLAAIEHYVNRIGE